MTKIYAHEGVSQTTLHWKRVTSTGNYYSLDHPKELVLPMRFLGEDHAGANPQGWERNNNTYFKELQSRHPEYFSRLNTHRILDQRTTPLVDKTFIQYFQEYKNFEQSPLVHHHIGGDGQAVALPKPLHNGNGEIHNIENSLGITRNGQEFSRTCANLVKKNPELLRRSSEEFHTLLKSDAQTLTNAFTAISSKEDKIRENSKLRVENLGRSTKR
ncbi:MAG TPA: hypothetical protein PK137_06560 [Anaerolineaceae bacterium]|jgi:hypothetical protein|nr:hypothetical protein [Flavobacteriales bacterium]HOG59537.1 hypothetical protein [Anaerolineaceae bacterium]HOR83692.1 hypothetical protein [Anaerolineaceae bacterium]HPL43492.1 hypothetical protein [Anaerolineaceae bacterium]HPY33133.1 hypothetical protein [Anaerolineaceae bacterium]